MRNQARSRRPAGEELVVVDERWKPSQKDTNVALVEVLALVTLAGVVFLLAGGGRKRGVSFRWRRYQ